MGRLRLPHFILAALVVAGAWALGAPIGGSGVAAQGLTCNGLPPTINGTSAGEVIVGTPGIDVISARGGNDIVLGLGSADVICGGVGNDMIDGGPGGDLLLGESGNDVLNGRAGADGLNGSIGTDTCTSGSGIDNAAGCEVSDIPTPLSANATILPTNSLIAQIDGTMGLPGDVYVEYHEAAGGDTFRSQAEASSGTDYLTNVLRLRADTAYDFQIIGQNNTGEWSSGPGGSFTTGSLPAGLADATFTVQSGAPVGTELVLMDFDDPDFRGLVAIDGEGYIVWYLDTTADYGTTAMAQKPNGNVVFIAEQDGLSGYLLIEVTPLGEIVDQVEEQQCPTTNHGSWHHELQVISDHEVMVLGRELQDSFNDPTRLQEGDTINIWDQNTDIVTEKWNVFDFFDPLTERTPDSDLTSGAVWKGCSGTETIQDWTHGNAATVAQDGSGDILYSARHLDQITSIAPDFQSLNWRLGGPNGDFTFPDPSDKFYHQHASFELPNGNILLWDNGNGRPAGEGGQYSRALELHLDFNTMEATKVWEYRHTPDLFTGCCSNSIRLDNGNTLMVFGSNFQQPDCCRTFNIVEADAAGNTVWEVTEQAPLKPIQYRVYPADSILGETQLP